MSEVEELIVKRLGIKDIHYNRQNLAVLVRTINTRLNSRYSQALW